ADAEQDDPAKRVADGEVDLFPAPEAPCADHEEADESDEESPDDGQPPGKDGKADESVNDGCEDSGGGRDRHADKILAIGAAGILGDGVDADVEAGEAAGAAEQKEEADECAELHELEAHIVVHGEGKGAKSPGVSEDAGGDAEGDDVGERVELLAEFALGIGKAGNTAVEGVEGDGETDGDSGVGAMMRL